MKKEISSQTFLRLKGKNVELSKIETKMIYQCYIDKKFRPPTSQSNLEKRINLGNKLDWNKIYSRIYSTSIDTYLHTF